MRKLLLAVLLVPVRLTADDLARQAQSVLAKNCLVCHGSALKSSALDLRTRESILQGGERGSGMVPGKGEQSRLYRFAAGVEQPSMPPGKTLRAEDLDVLKRWIDSGAHGAGVAEVEDPKVALAKLEERPVTDEERAFWSFQPVQRPVVPGSGNAVDAFLRQTLVSKGLKPSSKADRRTLIRRVSLDLTGLPPTPERVSQFVNDPSPAAWSRLVDELLASPAYGERWARHWLDLVRYADSGGYEFDRDRANSWRYRDYVIQSLNTDKPYDRFVREQIAGDEIAPESYEARIATGFLRLGPEANIKTEQTRMDELDDIIATTGATFLGMTIGCARCHNHKFDPIPQKDYYQIQAVFFPSKAEEVPLVGTDELARHRAEIARIDGLVKPLKKQMEAIEQPYRNLILEGKKEQLPEYVQAALKTPPEKRTEGQKLNAEQVEKTLNVKAYELEDAFTQEDAALHCELRAQVITFEQQRPPLDTAMGVVEAGPTPPPSHFLHHGSVSQKGSVMPPGVLTVAAKQGFEWPEAAASSQSSLRRRAFADWLTSTENPLTARVLVNRIWQHHFGEGIVRTSNNFGKTGEMPTHPALLDWLASEFVQQAWSLKAMHRLMLNSDAYQMASDDTSANRAIDPDNRYLWRMPRRRLEGEALRDSMLAVSGTLNRTRGGPGFHPYIDPALWASSSGRYWPGLAEDDPRTLRRSVYVFSKRTIPVPMLEVFDRPDSIGSCARRNRSTIAPQALILMNSAFVIGQSRHFADRLRKEAGDQPEALVERAYQLALLRSPTDSERGLAVEFLKSGPNNLRDFCQTLFNLNEFAYLQ